MVLLYADVHYTLTRKVVGDIKDIKSLSLAICILLLTNSPIMFYSALRIASIKRHTKALGSVYTLTRKVVGDIKGDIKDIIKS